MGCQHDERLKIENKERLKLRFERYARAESKIKELF